MADLVEAAGVLVLAEVAVAADDEGPVRIVASVPPTDHGWLGAVSKNAQEAADQYDDIEFEQGGTKIKLAVPDEVQLKVELEVETDERELEIELKW